MLCIRNGLLVLPGGVREADLYIRGDRIFSVGGRWADAEVIDAAGCWVFPGFLCADPPAGHFAEQSEKALAWGYTTLAASGSPGRSSTDYCRGYTEVSFEKEICTLRERGGSGCTLRPGLTEEKIRALLAAAAPDILVRAGAEQTERILSAAVDLNTPLWLGPLRNRKELESVRSARGCGAPILMEIGPEILSRRGAGEERKALLEALHRGEFDLFSGGEWGKGTALLLRELGEQGSRGLMTALHMLCEQPARALGLWPRKGALKVGNEADITIWDPNSRGVISGEEQPLSGGSTLRESQSVQGRARDVLLRGRLVAGRGIVLRYGLGRDIGDQPDR